MAKVYRDDALGKPSTRVHHCHASLVTAGLGYDDLNELMKSPRDLKFIFGNFFVLLKNIVALEQ